MNVELDDMDLESVYGGGSAGAKGISCGVACAACAACQANPGKRRVNRRDIANAANKPTASKKSSPTTKR